MNITLMAPFDQTIWIPSPRHAGVDVVVGAAVIDKATVEHLICVLVLIRALLVGNDSH